MCVCVSVCHLQQAGSCWRGTRKRHARRAHAAHACAARVLGPQTSAHKRPGSPQHAPGDRLLRPCGYRSAWQNTDMAAARCCCGRASVRAAVALTHPLRRWQNTPLTRCWQASTERMYGDTGPYSGAVGPQQHGVAAGRSLVVCARAVALSRCVIRRAQRGDEKSGCCACGEFVVVHGALSMDVSNGRCIPFTSSLFRSRAVKRQ
jgi:hypothetical protein